MQWRKKKENWEDKYLEEVGRRRGIRLGRRSRRNKWRGGAGV